MKTSAKFYFLVFFLSVLSPLTLSAMESNLVIEGPESDELKELMQFFPEDALKVYSPDFKPKRKGKSPAIISLITARQIRNMGARNLAEVLSTVPGIGLQTSLAWSRTEYEVRGVGGAANSEKVLILVDGHRLNDPFFGGATTVTQDIPLENVKQIEVIRGPGSALYGANAFMAVINIVTKKAEDIDGIQVTYGKGSFNTSRYNVLFGKTDGDLKVSGNVNYFETDSQDRYIEKDNMPFTTPVYSSGTTETPGYTNNHRTRYDVQLNVDYQEVGFAGRFINKENGALIGPRGNLSDETLMKFNAAYTELHHQYRFKDINLKVLNKLYYDYFDLDFFFEVFPEGTVSRTGGTFANGAITQGTAAEQTFGYNLQLDYDLFENNYLTLGFVWEYLKQNNVTTKANYDPNAPTPGEPTSFSQVPNYNHHAGRTILAFYAQDQWAVYDWVSFTLGIRHDRYSDVGFTTNPRMGLVFNPVKDLDIKLLYGEAFRAPNFTELHNQNNPAVLGDDGLKPEKMRTAEAGIVYRLFNKYRVSANYFYSRIDDLIALGAWTAASTRSYDNLTDVDTRGIETSLKANFFQDENLKDYYLYANYSYQLATDRTTGRRLPNAPDHRGNLGLNLALGKYVNLQPHMFVSGRRLRAKGDSRHSLGAYSLFDLAMVLKNFYDRFQVRVVVHNLTDRRYVHPATATVFVNDLPQQGRDFYMEASYTF